MGDAPDRGKKTLGEWLRWLHLNGEPRKQADVAVDGDRKRLLNRLRTALDHYRARQNSLDRR